MIRIKRVYDKPSKDDGVRVLIDGLWPRGLSKEKAQVDLWSKDIAVSPQIRKWFAHDPAKWLEFKRRYYDELDSNKCAVAWLIDKIKTSGKVTLLYGSREDKFNNAVALKEYLEEELVKVPAAGH
jgi:uncharacterized protein YeaO (DUF488 family)